MSAPQGFDFTKFVPGFDFLKNLTPGASGTAAAPGWVAPTLDPEELDKRIQELKTVQFWLEQNAKAVGATIQALEVQRMTLATLKGMNMSFNDLAESLKVKPMQDTEDDGAPAKASPFQFNTSFDQPAAKTKSASKPRKAAPKKKTAGTGKSSAAQTAAAVDPSHWWGALTDQFQHIAHKAMTDMAHTAQQHAGAPKAAKASSSAAASSAKPAANQTKSASGASKSPARKTAAKKTSTKSKR
ncbi:MAG: hypothetical protein RI902_2308 [Pseudomonadota bacterium]|jgi:hypothetical protein